MRTAIVLGLIFGLMVPLSAAEGRQFTIDGLPIAEAEVLDARALPTLSGQPDIMVTLTDSAAKKVVQRSRERKQTSLPVSLDGKPLLATTDPDPSQTNVVQIKGDYRNIDEASRLAKRISGKDPLPDSLDEDDL